MVRIAMKGDCKSKKLLVEIFREKNKQYFGILKQVPVKGRDIRVLTNINEVCERLENYSQCFLIVHKGRSTIYMVRPKR